MPGPRPTPTHLRLLRGNPGKRPLNRNEPQPTIPPEPPDPPAFLMLTAIDEWWRVAPDLPTHRLGLLTAVDVAPLAAYCQSYARWRQAEEALAEMAELNPVTGALLVKTASGGGAAQNPLVRVATVPAADMKRRDATLISRLC